MREKTLKKRVVTPAMLLVTIGVVYGDIGTSPMYVLKSIIENNGGLQTVNRAFIIGSLSLIIWTVTLITTVKYVVVARRIITVRAVFLHFTAWSRTMAST